MADVQDMAGASAPQREKSTRLQTAGTMANWAGAAISLGLVVGIGVWGYKILSRDVSGVPVVRAAEGPMRVQPEDPGGRPALNQGLAVNDVAAVGTAAAPADRLVLAPKPIELTDEDAPQASLANVAPKLEIEPVAPLEPASQTAVQASKPQMHTIQDLADKLAAGVAPLEQPAAPTPSEAVEKVTKAAVVVPVSTPKIVPGGVGRSLRPQLRPVSLKTAQQKSIEKALGQAATAQEVDPASIAAGTRLVQLGAFDSPEIAREAWGRLETRFGDYLEGKSRVVQKAQSGGRTFYRLRAVGFADLNDARRFCSALVAEKADCIPVTTR